jgi:hypothetical protein
MQGNDVVSVCRTNEISDTTFIVGTCDPLLVGENCTRACDPPAVTVARLSRKQPSKP